MLKIYALIIIGILVYPPTIYSGDIYWEFFWKSSDPISFTTWFIEFVVVSLIFFVFLKSK
jgi:lysylphosphatidylglycerol synthetase-like protein (DUF2156 family)